MEEKETSFLLSAVLYSTGVYSVNMLIMYQLVARQFSFTRSSNERDSVKFA